MAQVTVMKSNPSVTLDGEKIKGVDLSDLPDNFHALQWNGSSGQIEHSQWNTETGAIDYSIAVKPNDYVSSEAEIENLLGISLSTILERRTAKKEEIESDPDYIAEMAKREK